MEFLESLILMSFAAGTSLLYATLGEIFTEKAGVLNLGIEGTMMLSALSSFAAVYYSGSLFMGLLTAMVVGMLCSLIHGAITISLRSNQVVSGLGITLLGTGLATFLAQRLGPESNSGTLFGLSTLRFHPVEIPLLSKIPLAGALFRQDILTYILFLLVPLCWFFLYRSRLGLNLRAIGENPTSATAMGLSVTRDRYLYTLFGGLMSGLAGAHLSLSYTPGWTENITGGRGWIVIALVILAKWNPGRAFPGALLFGGVYAFQFHLQSKGIETPSLFLNMLPYLTTILMLILMSASEKMQKGFAAPAGLGRAYIPEDS